MWRVFGGWMGGCRELGIVCEARLWKRDCLVAVRAFAREFNFAYKSPEKKKKALVAVKQGAVVKRKSLRSISIAVAPTTQCLECLHEITNLNRIFKQPRPWKVEHNFFSPLSGLVQYSRNWKFTETFVIVAESVMNEQLVRKRVCLRPRSHYITFKFVRWLCCSHWTTFCLTVRNLKITVCTLHDRSATWVGGILG